MGSHMGSPKARITGTVARASLITLAGLGGLVVSEGSTLGAGLEAPDVGAVATGRGGANAARPLDGLAFQYNPAGLGWQPGLRLTLDGRWAWQKLTFQPMGSDTTVSRGGGAFLVPAAFASYGFRLSGPISLVTVGLGATGPSAIGKSNYPKDGPQRYSLIDADYFIAYGSASVAATWRDRVALGVTFQLVHGTAKFKQAVWSGPSAGTDPQLDAIATVDVKNGWTPTAVFGVSGRVTDRISVGASWRPGFSFVGHGTLTTDLPNLATALQARQIGDATEFVVDFPTVLRFGVEGTLGAERRLVVESDFVYEGWSRLKTIEIHPQDIQVHSDSFDITKPLPNIVFQKDFHAAYSVRLGADYLLIPRHLVVRAGYLHETSAIPTSGVSVDFGNWARDVVSVGASVPLVRSLILDLAYAHHFVASQDVTDSKVVQIVTPCLSPGCRDAPATTVGNGHYEAALDVFGASLRWALDDLRPSP